MLITLTNLKNKKEKVVAVGKTVTTPEKTGYKKSRTIGGKPMISHSVIVNECSIELSNLREEDKDIINKFWKKNIELELVDEKFNIITGYIDAATLPPEEYYLNGEILYSMKFNFI